MRFCFVLIIMAMFLTTACDHRCVSICKCRGGSAYEGDDSHVVASSGWQDIFAINNCLNCFEACDEACGEDCAIQACYVAEVGFDCEVVRE